MIRSEATSRGLVLVQDGQNFDPTSEGWLWGHEARFAPSSQAIKRTLDAGHLGAVGLVRIHDWRPKTDADRNGRIAQQLDLVCWLIGASPTSVLAKSHGDDYFQAHLGFPGDAMAVIVCAACLPEGDGYRSLSVIGSAGAAYADAHRNLHLAFAGGPPRAIFAGEGHAASAAEAEYHDALQSGREPGGAADWRRADRLLAAARRSIAAHEVVIVDGEVDEAAP